MSPAAPLALGFLVEWALRSAALILAGALLLRVFRVKAPAVTLAACIVMLVASLALPLLARKLPTIAIGSVPIAPAPDFDASAEPVWPIGPVSVGMRAATAVQGPLQYDWRQIALIAYFAIGGMLLLRLFAALLVSALLLRRSRPAGISAGGIEVRESDEATGPFAVGIVRPVILIPRDWRDWHAAKLDAVLAHERSHIERRDPAVQLLSAIHRALLWHSPASWLLHRCIVRTAEEASDDAAIVFIRDRASYAQTLLEFMRTAPRTARLQGVAMARYANIEARIDRILESAAPSPGMTRKGVAGLLALGSPLVFLAAAAHLERAPAPASLTFKFISIRRAAANERPGPLRPLPDATGYFAQDVPLKTMIGVMYRVPVRHIEGAPGWLDSDGYDIEAAAGGAHTLDELHSMFRNLLAGRFHLTLHKEIRPGPVYVLAVDPGGSKMHPDFGSDLSQYPVNWGKGGVVNGARVSMEHFAWWLSENAPGEKRPVIDRTGLRQNYNFTLKFAPQLPPDFDRSRVRAEVLARPSVFDALREQLGLTLTAETGPMEYLIIDHVERPAI